MFSSDVSTNKSAEHSQSKTGRALTAMSGVLTLFFVALAKFEVKAFG